MIKRTKITNKIISFLLTGLIVVSALAAAPAPKAVAADGLVARWTFDGDYNESVNGLKTELGAKVLSYVEGVHGKAAVFNGKDTYLKVLHDEVLDLGNSLTDKNNNFSFSFWTNLYDGLNSERYVLTKGIRANWHKNDDWFWDNPYEISFDGTRPRLRLSNKLIGPGDVYWDGEETAGDKYIGGEEWSLITMTYDGDRIKIYRDDRLIDQKNYTSGIAFNNDSLYIGVNGDGLSQYFKGALDDLRIYQKTLSYSDVEALYQEGVKANKELVEPAKQLVAYYSFDGNLKDSSIFKNDAKKISIGGITKYAPGKNGKAVTMSKGNYIEIEAASQHNFDEEYTISFWFKLNPNKEGSYPILYQQNPSKGANNDNEANYSIYLSSWAKAEWTSIDIRTNVDNEDSWTISEGPGIGDTFNKIKTTNWFHSTFTYKNGQVKYYLNGKLRKKSEVSDITKLLHGSGNLLIGYDGDRFMEGSLDELKIYNKALNATEVAKEANRVDSVAISAADSKKLQSAGKGKSLTITGVVFKDGDTKKTSSIKASDGNVKFTSSNKKIFTVTNSGKITGKKKGTAKLTVTYGGNAKTYTVKVK